MTQKFLESRLYNLGELFKEYTQATLANSFNQWKNVLNISDLELINEFNDEKIISDMRFLWKNNTAACNI